MCACVSELRITNEISGLMDWGVQYVMSGYGQLGAEVEVQMEF